MPDAYVIGFDVGGTRIKSGAVSADGALTAAGVRPSGYALDPPRLLEALEEEVRRIVDAQEGPPRMVALGFPGVVDPDVGVVYLPGKIKGLEGFPVVPRLAEATGLPVVADNDGRLSILAEAHYGKARDVRWAVTVTIGTGIGSGVMLDGRVLRDPHLQFGTQLGHVVQQAYGGPLCLTGARGTAELLCSATALAMSVRHGLARGIPSALSDRFFDDPRSVDFKAVVEAVRAGDRLCADEFERWRANLGWLLVSAVHLYAPERIILSGGGANAADLFLEEVRAQVNGHIYRYPKGEPVDIVLSELRDHAGVLGAAALAWERTGAP